MLILRCIFGQTEGENSVKNAYEQIVEKSVNVGLAAWRRLAKARQGPGNSWAITLLGRDECREIVYNPALIRQPLTGG